MSEVDFFLGQSDTSPSLVMTLLEPGGAPVDLTGATVTFQIRRTTAPRTLAEGPATILAPATDGRIRYDWGTADAAVPGTYEGRAKVVLASGKQLSFPNYRTLRIDVTADP